MVEVDHVLAHRRAIQGAGEQAEDKRETVALVTADRQQKSFFRAPRIGKRPPFAIDHPAFRHRFATLCLGFHLAVRRDGGGHVEDDGRLPVRGDRDRDRIGGQQHVHPAPRRKMVGIADSEIYADHVVRKHFACV